MDFIAIDFETANAHHHPCSFGLVVVENNEITKEYYTLINPMQPFSRANCAIHGITEDMVADAPLFPDVWNDVKDYFYLYPVVAHGVRFDKTVLEKTAQRNKLDLFSIPYYDTSDLYRDNYNISIPFDLLSVCEVIGISIQNPHDALAAARASAHIMLSILAEKDNVIKPTVLGNTIDSSTVADHGDPMPASISYMPNIEPDNEEASTIMCNIDDIVFNGSTCVITGVIPGYDRTGVIEIINMRGGRVAGTVSGSTHYVIAGFQGVDEAKDEDAGSCKLTKAEELWANGCNIRIISADVFISLLRSKGRRLH